MSKHRASARAVGRPAKLWVLAGAGLGLGLGGAAVATASGCQDTDRLLPTPDGGVVADTLFQPEGCDFKVAPRPEYMDYSVGRTEVGATPNIRRVRLGLGGHVSQGAPGRADPATSFGVAWQTDDGTLISEVEWGAGPDPASWDPADRTSGFTWLTPAGTLNSTGDARMHEAYVCGLEPDTTYYYRVGGGGQWSEVHRFKTTPKDPSTEVKILVTGDSRGQENDAWRILQRRVMQLGVDAQLFSGDMINLAPDQGEWERWLDAAWKDSDGTLSTLGQVLTLSAHGNHDNHTSLFYGNLVLPQEPEKYPAYSELFFSVDIGPVHVIVLDDAYLAFPTGDSAFGALFEEWLRADLEDANANRDQVPWIITMHHRPCFSSSNHGDDGDVLRVRDFLVPIYDEYHVDLSLAGHDHNYERTRPITGPASNPSIQPSPAEGTVYLVCAGAGADPYSSGTSTFTEISRDYKTGGAIGFYGVVTATQSELRLEAHELRPDGSDPVFDTMTITR